MAISASAVAPPGDAPVRFPDTRAAKQPTLSKKRQGAGEEGNTSSLLQARHAVFVMRMMPGRAVAVAAGWCADARVSGSFAALCFAQVAVVSTFLLVKWARVWWEARRKAKAAPPPPAQ